MKLNNFNTFQIRNYAALWCNFPCTLLGSVPRFWCFIYPTTDVECSHSNVLLAQHWFFYETTTYIHTYNSRLHTATGSTGESWYMFVHVGTLCHISWDSFCFVVTLRISFMEWFVICQKCPVNCWKKNQHYIFKIFIIESGKNSFLYEFLLIFKFLLSTRL